MTADGLWWPGGERPPLALRGGGSWSLALMSGAWEEPRDPGRGPRIIICTGLISGYRDCVPDLEVM
jgi:hypothetical protein